MKVEHSVLYNNILIISYVLENEVDLLFQYLNIE